MQLKYTKEEYMKKIWVLILAFLLISTTAFMNTESPFASTDENTQEELERGEGQAAEEGNETSGHEEELSGEEHQGEDYQSPEEELPEEEDQSPEEEQYIPDPEEGRS